MPSDIGVSASTVDGAAMQAGPSTVGGLDTFDWATFDYTSPASWETLGKAWNVSNGYLPSQEELMQFIAMMSANMSGGAYSMATQYNNMQTQQPQQQQWDGGQSQQGWGRGDASWRGRGRGRGRGYGDAYAQGHSYQYGNGRGASRGRGRGFDHDTDALTLAGGDDTPAAYAMQTNRAWQEDEMYGGQQPLAEHPVSDDAGARGGRMQRQGDGWVFVKSDAS